MSACSKTDLDFTIPIDLHSRIFLLYVVVYVAVPKQRQKESRSKIRKNANLFWLSWLPMKNYFMVIKLDLSEKPFFLMYSFQARWSQIILFGIFFLSYWLSQYQLWVIVKEVNSPKIIFQYLHLFNLPQKLPGPCSKVKSNSLAENISGVWTRKLFNLAQICYPLWEQSIIK